MEKWRTVWACEEPPAGSTYLVVRSAWSNVDDVPVWTIFEVQVLEQAAAS